VHQYVLEQRMARAKYLLLHTDLSVAEIAFRSGLPNQSHFTTVFRKIVGATPREYRRSGLS
jgi:AraC family transcriptional regulator